MHALLGPLCVLYCHFFHIFSSLFLLFILFLGTRNTNTALILTPLRTHFLTVSLSHFLSPLFLSLAISLFSSQLHPKPGVILRSHLGCSLWPSLLPLGSSANDWPTNPSSWESVSVSTIYNALMNSSYEWFVAFSPSVNIVLIDPRTPRLHCYLLKDHPPPSPLTLEIHLSFMFLMKNKSDQTGHSHTAWLGFMDNVYR